MINRLWKAAERGDVAAVQEALDAGRNVNSKLVFPFPPHFVFLHSPYNRLNLVCVPTTTYCLTKMHE